MNKETGGIARQLVLGVVQTHDPIREARLGQRCRERIAELAAMADQMTDKLNAQGKGETAKGRRACDRGAYSRFTRAVAEAKLTRFLKADLNADRFSYSVDAAAIASAGLFDGKLALVTNAPERIRAHALNGFLALVPYRVMRTRLKPKGHSASPRTALDLLGRIQRHTIRIGERKLDGLTTITPEQLELFDTLKLPQPA